MAPDTTQAKRTSSGRGKQLIDCRERETERERETDREDREAEPEPSRRRLQGAFGVAHEESGVGSFSGEAAKGKPLEAPPTGKGQEGTETGEEQRSKFLSWILNLLLSSG